jgi:ABC-type siderophore export system fused ATPase/permease subunit
MTWQLSLKAVQGDSISLCSAAFFQMLNERGMFLIMTMWLELLCGIAANAFSVQPPCPANAVAFYG